jgi:hypothetical protein
MDIWEEVVNDCSVLYWCLLGGTEVNHNIRHS